MSTSSPELRVLQPSGNLDYNQTTQFRRAVADVIAAGVKTVLLDLQAVTFMDSSGLGSLVSALKTVRGAGGSLYLCSVTPQIKMLLELTGLDRVFQVYADRQAFEAASK